MRFTAGSGYAPDSVPPPPPPRSHPHTTPSPYSHIYLHPRALSRRADLEVKLQELAGALAEDMAEEGLRGRTLTLKLKLTTFEVCLERR